MSFWTDDVAGMLSGFGETVILPGGKAATAIFQNEFEAQSVYGVDVDSSSPVFVCQSSDVDFMSIGSEVGYNSKQYYVQSIQSDGAGMTILVVSEDK